MKAVAYYRSRPGEPETSDLALSRQREAVRQEVEQHGLDLVAEFIEREGEAGSQACPAYVAAVHAASACSSGEGFLDATLIIAAQAAIGSGEPFQEPTVKVEGAGGFLSSYLQVRSIPAQAEIKLPAGAPGPLCLYADSRPRQLDTSIYLCNHDREALAEVVVIKDTISMNEFFSAERGEEPWADGRTYEQRWDVIPPGTGVMVASLDHCISDYVTRHRVAYTDATGRRWTAKAHDLKLAFSNQAGEPSEAWVTFSPVREAIDEGAPEKPHT